MKFDILASFCVCFVRSCKTSFVLLSASVFPKDLIILADFSIRRSACAFSLRCFAKMDSCSWIDSDSLPNSRLNFASCACLLSQSFAVLISATIKETSVWVSVSFSRKTPLLPHSGRPKELTVLPIRGWCLGRGWGCLLFQSFCSAFFSAACISRHQLLLQRSHDGLPVYYWKSLLLFLEKWLRTILS